MSEVVACDLCASSQTERYPCVAPPEQIVVKCSLCKLVYRNPQPSNIADLGKADPLVWRSVEDRKASYKIDDYKCKLNELAEYKKGGRLLDVGCGHGFMLEIARERGYEVFGVEIQEALAAYAREQLGLSVVTGEILTANYGSEFFDVITMWEVLEHMSSPNAAIREAARILKKDGVLSIVVPNVESHNARVNVHWWVPYHLYYFSPETISRMLEQNGFTVKKLIVNPHVSLIESANRRRFVYRHFAWAVKGGRRIAPYLYRTAAYKRHSGSIMVYARKQEDSSV